MRKLLMIVASLVVAAAVYALPARSGVKKTVTQPDGSTLTLTLCGDEHFHYYTGPDGMPMRENAQGEWVKDTRDIAALWTASTKRRTAHRTVLAEKTRKLARMARTDRQKRRIKGSSNSVTGTKKGLLILVNFPDKQMVNKDKSKAIYEHELNGIGDPYNGNQGSVREYFRTQSYGLLDIEFDVVGPVTVSQLMSYYGGNDADGNDLRPAEMVDEAVKLVDDEVNFADYDWDGDGEVENIYVTYAGYSEAQGAPRSTIWPHQSTLNDMLGEWAYNWATDSWMLVKEYVLKLDGVRINTYATGSELTGKSGTQLDGIGTMCHEYSHCLGLPDFYDTSYAGGFGMYSWSILDHGNYNNEGYCPAGYTAYERWFCGWLEPTELTGPATVTDMPCIEDEPVAYVIYNDNNRNEYYLLANHQKKGWNRYQGGAGLMVMHVDYDENVWANNTVNSDPMRQRMTIIPADGRLSQTTTKRDLWPYSDNVSLTDISSPKAALYNKNTDGVKLMHKPIENVKMENGLVSFDFMGGNPECVITAISDLPADSSMKPVTADIYDLSGRRVQHPGKGLYIINGKKVLIR